MTGFIVLQLALAIGIERWFPALRDPEVGPKITRLRQCMADASSKPFTVVMLGSSRTNLGFKADALERLLTAAHGRPTVVFNFGVNGAGPLVELMNLHRILADGIRPDLLLVEVMPPFLAGQVPLYELWEESVPTDRLAWGDLPLIERYAQPVRSGLYNKWWSTTVVPWYSRRFRILSQLAPHLLPHGVQTESPRGMDPSGWVDHDWGPRTAERRKTALDWTHNQFNHFLQGYRLGGPACEGLRELLETCRREQIPTALVLMPEGPNFRSWYSSEAWQQVESFLSTLSLEFGTPVVSARDWIGEENFADSQHLLPEAAEAFTERLGREEILPLLRQGQRPAPARIERDVAQAVSDVRR